jgi:Protein of unknown function (DUF3313)
MNRFMTAGACALLLCGFAIPASAKDESGGTWDGLVEVKPKRLDAAFLMPGADFRQYTKLMVDPVEVAFRKDWMKDMNDSRVGLSNRITQTDAEKIAAAAREGFDEIFHEAFSAAGMEIVTTPGADVLRVRPGVVDLYIAAPDKMSSGMSRTYTVEAGQATLFLEVLDSTTGALLGRALDKRATRNTGRASMANSVTNRADFRALFKQWADIAVKGFEDLRSMSPVPQDLQPGQKLQP